MSETDGGFLALFEAHAARNPTRVYARFSGEPVTFGELNGRAASLATWLEASGVRAGSHVALMMRNSPLSLALMFAIAKLDAVWVPINVAARGDALAYIIEHSGPALVIADDDVLATLEAAGTSAAATRSVAASAATIVMHAEVSSVPARWPTVGDADHDPDRPYAIMYTSGTTGRPKGVIVSHRMLRLSGEGVAVVSAARDGDVMFMWEPLFHIGGAQMIVLPLIRDVELALVERFSASRFWRQVKDAGASHIHYLGGILQMLSKQPPGPLDRNHGVRIAWGGGCPRDLWQPFEERFGVAIRECYGMTECSSITTANRNGTVGSVGTPVPWFDVTVVRPDGTEADVGEQGEIIVTTALAGALTRGYLNNPEASGRALRNGAFHTGDFASRDADGNLFFHGRMTDSARVNGENVSAFEVENVAAGHPAVEDCAMIPVAAEIGEQDIKLFVLAKAGAAIDPAALSDWLAPRLAPYQRPRYIAVIDTFERTPSQRIMKHRLSRRTDDAWDRKRSGHAT